MGWLDLHMHSSISNDGEFSPKRLMELCSQNQLKVVALADHNSVRGIKEAKTYADKFEIELISAIELDCTFRGVDLHVLGYGIDPTYGEFEEIEQSVEEQERTASKKRIDLVESIGINFEYDEVMNLSKNGVVTGEMIAEAALKDDRNKNNLLMKPYYPGGKRSDNPYVNFYWDICSMGKGAYVQMEFISLFKAVKLIYDSGGIPVLAHPGNNIKEDKELLNDIVSAGVIGMEVYSSYHSKAQMEFYADIADKNGLIKTLGSDFHGKTKPSIKLGSVNCQDSEEKIYQELIQKIKA